MTTLVCSSCGQPAATFRSVAGAIVYAGVLGKRLRTERAFDLSADPRALEAFMKDDSWREVKADDVTPAYTIGEPIFSLDAYCPACDRVYCKEHMTVRAFANAGYGEWIIATCPRGHERKVYDDFREP